MRTRIATTSTFFILGSFVITLFTPSVNAGVVDERNPRYIQMINYLEQAEQALEIAEKALEDAQDSQTIPGMRTEKLIATINQLRNELTIYLTPDRRRLRYEYLQPNPLFFSPPSSEQTDFTKEKDHD